ncbi:Cytochrome b561 and DOMON domain-containing protein [Melia azedarach]|uniref:Cytochrome b561 and DOMON domain-containing protein n=1 Tax=Melia azedarach TaxID=155640 RepID=A0ACC1YZF2_MELAZ|nr:Cytochrome b561 and DOMON domain-containing protein [Melia azedarach]
MPSLFLPSLTVILSVCVLLFSPAHSLTCTSQKLTKNRLFEKCADLPTLDSFLHYTYNASNSSLSIAFVSTPASADGWVAWAINPISNGMAGSQTLLALKSNGSLVVKTFNISSYSSIVESKLSFETWDLSAESGQNGTVTIYGKLKVPEKAEKLNQVWQVGAKVTDGKPNKHEFSAANLKSTGTLNLEEKAPSTSPGAAPGVAPGGPTPDKGGQSTVKSNNVGLFLSLILFFGSVFAL